MEELEKQKEEAKDGKQKKDIEGKLSLKRLERGLADAKRVREDIMPTNNKNTCIAMSLCSRRN